MLKSMPDKTMQNKKRFILIIQYLILIPVKTNLLNEPH